MNRVFGLIVAALLFNCAAFMTNKRLTKNQIIHIWTFTIALQNIVDLYLSTKYEAYWYFTKEIKWESFPARVVLIPAVNMLFLSWYPFRDSLSKRVVCFISFWILIVLYEASALLPEPWGYLRYGWWNLIYSALSYPFLLILILKYYQWICRVESYKP
ncbi:hypothetical protein [Anoxybacillus rupiensis]|jgi:hypothetical protein|uniref:hypothetical protein n=1 Tax=Anoxybacillaceae TaxID=3120669 RepID=UPI0030B82F98